MTKKATLGRTAGGLPRFYLDTGWWRHPRFSGLEIAALFVFQASISYGNEHATDGYMPANLEDLAVVLGLRLSDVRKAAPQLLTKGVWFDVGDGRLRVDGFEDHNPTRGEIDAYTNERSSHGRMGNHQRWHVNKGVTDPHCDLCRTPSSDSPPDRLSDPYSDSETDRSGIAWDGMGWDGTKESSSSDTPRNGPHPVDDDEAVRLGTQDHDAAIGRGTPMTNPAKHLAECIARRRSTTPTVVLTRPPSCPCCQDHPGLTELEDGTFTDCHCKDHTPCPPPSAGDLSGRVDGPDLSGRV